MTKLLSGLAASLLTASLATTAAVADSPKATHGKMASGKMVSLYQADKCHMYFTAAQAKKYHYACPDSKGKMKMVKVSPAVAAKGIAATNAALAPKKPM